MSSKQSCAHEILQLEPSPFAELAGFKRPGAKERCAAEFKSGKMPLPVHYKLPPELLLRGAAEGLKRIFPAPLVLPHDDLNYEPDERAQSMKSWIGEKARNKCGGNGRTVLYVADVPSIGTAVEKLGMSTWMKPVVDHEREELEGPVVKEVMEYLKGFYHGMKVQQFPTKLSWTTWKSTARTNPKTKGVPKYVALQHGDAATRIRARPAPDGVFPAQLNLDDILDAAIEILPKDAYALLLLVDHDIYENEDDDFCCGRAYGGSRVAVVQSARYNPILDTSNGIDHAHTWPMSHCKSHVDDLCAVEEVLAEPPTRDQQEKSGPGPFRAAVDAASTLSPPTSKAELQGLWFSRLARTASHELGHCFGMAHCVYYACNMQGTAGMKEDARQPPYLCPVCMAKLGHAVCVELKGEESGEGREERVKKKEWENERYKALWKFCEKKGRDKVVLWKGLGEWCWEVMRTAGYY
ncbi:hypothetical protein K458DRAFT_416388 [Lentithecium fluviatile CBS 122367]|uniref:Archaemetzincin-2 n=1 Tax=Lentithecium fluviatile CBS 122367 TaxID=1168545 RepID=A0A6G1J730_9PLEO|nr:hypothetical protein K458DRAFT_416388 [Lentithecium fluviatile CBS 122367]